MPAYGVYPPSLTEWAEGKPPVSVRFAIDALAYVRSHWRTLPFDHRNQLIEAARMVICGIATIDASEAVSPEAFLVACGAQLRQVRPMVGPLRVLALKEVKVS